MDINHLAAFLAVAEHGSFSQAANQLYLTQPAISKRIQSLEAQLNCKLFDRIGRDVILTEAGQVLKPCAQNIVLELNEAKRQVQNLKKNISGQLSIASSHHIGLHYLSPILKKFREAYPDVNIDIQFLDSEQAIDGVLKRHIEVAFITLPLNLNHELNGNAIWQDPMKFVINADHPLSKRDSLRLNEIASMTAILPDKRTTTFKIIEQIFAKHRLPLKTTMPVNYLETNKMLVASGLGWSVLPKSLIDDSLCTLNVENAEIKRQLGWINHKQRTPSNAASALIELIQND